jgi:aminobenzoyl-glutamate utilization protein A
MIADGSPITERLLEQAAALTPRVVEWRRDLHRHPELGWTEFRTSALIADELERFGFAVRVGREAVVPEARLGLPAADVLEAAWRRAQDEGASAARLEAMRGGLTGVVARLEGGAPGPTIGFRFDIDALPILEASDEGHRPARDGFVSAHPGVMHACGHDGHAALGLGLAAAIAALRERWPGALVLVFQPSEEGGRGALPMVEAGAVDDCEALVCCHLGAQSRITGHVVGGVSGFLATTKIDAVFKGAESHAALEPEVGRNALLGAATAALHAIARHSEGSSRINVGVLEAGTGRNVTPGTARMQLEVRGENDRVLAFVERRARAILEAAAAMHELQLQVEVAGRAPSAASDTAVIERVREVARHVPEVVRYDHTVMVKASDDAAALMQRVQQRGGSATYFIIGSELAAGHHMPHFDIDDRALGIGVKMLALIAWSLASRPLRRARPAEAAD